jgi:hypothetical protein
MACRSQVSFKSQRENSYGVWSMTAALAACSLADGRPPNLRIFGWGFAVQALLFGFQEFIYLFDEFMQLL